MSLFRAPFRIISSPAATVSSVTPPTEAVIVAVLLEPEERTRLNWPVVANEPFGMVRVPDEGLNDW